MVQCRRVGDKPNKFSFVNFCIEKTKCLNAFVKTQNQNMIFQTKKRYKNSFEWIVHFDKYVINWFVGLKVRIGILECCCLWIFIFINVSYVMEFLAWWVLKSKVFAQKSTVVKWSCCILGIDIEWGLQKLGLILESKMVQKLSLKKMVLTKNGLLNWYS